MNMFTIEILMLSMLHMVSETQSEPWAYGYPALSASMRIFIWSIFKPPSFLTNISIDRKLPLNLL
jgi:hypothetical protein